MDTARQNLASVFVNAFVNTAFCNDKLMNVGNPEGQESNSWIYKTKESVSFLQLPPLVLLIYGMLIKA